MDIKHLIRRRLRCIGLMLTWENGTNINQVRTRDVVVKFFAADGKYLGSAVAANGAASYAVSESLVIAKVGKNSIKIAMK